MNNKGMGILEYILILAMIAISITLFCSKPVSGAEYSDQELLERVVEAEAGNQDMTGKRLVAAVILNRVDDERFPDTIREVLTAPRQFTTVINGTINRIKVSDDTRAAVRMELVARTDTEIVYFNNGPVSGKYAYKHQDHSFGR